MKQENGLIYVFEGDGKGKTSAALGIAVRMLLLGKRVIWISWFKSLKWPISEAKMTEIFPDKLMMYWMGEGFYIKTAKEKKLVAGAVAVDRATPAAHTDAAKKGLELATQILTAKNPPELLVLDELIKAVNEKLLTEKAVLNLISKRGETHLVITGHDCPVAVLEVADLVTEMKKIKHPYDVGQLAMKGLDF